MTLGTGEQHYNAMAQWRDAFTEHYQDMLALAMWCFRDKERGEREQCALRTMGNAWRDFARMLERGKTLDETTELLPNIVNYAAKHIRMGRDVGNHQLGQDAHSQFAHQKHSFVTEPWPDHDVDSHTDSLVDALADKRANPAEQAALRMDYRSWLGKLSPKKRTIAEMLAKGEDRKDICHTAKIGEARLSQIKGELAESYADFEAGCEPVGRDK